ncbi:hypothetical protein PPERSA_11002 [Pseudocohnilembus persalinus]|uniref:Uncharacterized protein n=1 Tax=Pseudocohnilembus persalinus TaxID=266149 RepID=A0A0V0QZG1_PSEPJ|nr:hypothetical protein PPERSA_11002 [Pseudocohnilembus persalinus]|eukprot:KRX07453.1 hypothetical protein PPERSA_11002 [Pseudocohnilembus persalinus]
MQIQNQINQKSNIQLPLYEILNEQQEDEYEDNFSNSSFIDWDQLAHIDTSLKTQMLNQIQTNNSDQQQKQQQQNSLLQQKQKKKSLEYKNKLIQIPQNILNDINNSHNNNRNTFKNKQIPNNNFIQQISKSNNLASITSFSGKSQKSPINKNFSSNQSENFNTTDRNSIKSQNYLQNLNNNSQDTNTNKIKNNSYLNQIENQLPQLQFCQTSAQNDWKKLTQQLNKSQQQSHLSCLEGQNSLKQKQNFIQNQFENKIQSTNQLNNEKKQELNLSGKINLNQKSNESQNHSVQSSKTVIEKNITKNQNLNQSRKQIEETLPTTNKEIQSPVISLQQSKQLSQQSQKFSTRQQPKQLTNLSKKFSSSNFKLIRQDTLTFLNTQNTTTNSLHQKQASSDKSSNQSPLQRKKTSVQSSYQYSENKLSIKE